MDSIILSSFVPNLDKLSIGKKYLDGILSNFADADIFVAINPGSISEWESELGKYKSKYKNIHIIKVHQKFDTKSDAAGFQQALSEIKKINKKYDYIWFAHTKGTTQDRLQMLNDIIINFFGRRKEIIQKMVSEKLGAYGRYITVGISSKNTDNILDSLYPFPYASRNIYFLYTFYVIDGCIINKFLLSCNDSFFNKNILELPFGNRYFFEGDFPSIVDKLGYTLGYDRVGYNPFWNRVSKKQVDLYRNTSINDKKVIKKIIFFRMIFVHKLMTRLILFKNFIPTDLIIKIKRFLLKLHILQSDFE